MVIFYHCFKLILFRMARLEQLIFVFCLIRCSFGGWRSRNETKFHKYVGVNCESLNEKMVKFETCGISKAGGVDLTIEFLQPLEEIFVNNNHLKNYK